MWCVFNIENTVFYSPGFCEVASVPGGVAMGVVADCDLLSADTTSTTNVVLISTEMWIKNTTTIWYSWYKHYLCTWNCIHAPLPFLLSPSSRPPHLSHYTHIMILMHDCREPLPVHTVKIILQTTVVGVTTHLYTNLWVHGCCNNLDEGCGTGDCSTLIERHRSSAWSTTHWLLTVYLWRHINVKINSIQVLAIVYGK